jgi:hypothetical protein
MGEDTKGTARRFLEVAFPRGEFDDLLAPDYRDHNAPPGTPPGPAGIRQLTQPYREAFPRPNC